MRLLVEELLCLCIQRCALLHGSEASDLQHLARLHDGLHPWILLATGKLFLAHDFAALVLDQVLCTQAANSLLLAAAEHQDLAEFSPADLAHGLLLHRLHGLHGCLLLHHFHGLHGCLLLHRLHGLHGCLLFHHLHGLHGCLLLHHLHGLHGCLLLHDLHGLHGCLLLHHLHGLHGCLLLHHLHGLHGCLLLHHLHRLHGCHLLHDLHCLHCLCHGDVKSWKRCKRGWIP